MRRGVFSILARPVFAATDQRRQIDGLALDILHPTPRRSRSSVRAASLVPLSAFLVSLCLWDLPADSRQAACLVGLGPAAGLSYQPALVSAAVPRRNLPGTFRGYLRAEGHCSRLASLG